MWMDRSSTRCTGTSGGIKHVVVQISHEDASSLRLEVHDNKGSYHFVEPPFKASDILSLGKGESKVDGTFSVVRHGTHSQLYALDFVLSDGTVHECRFWGPYFKRAAERAKQGMEKQRAGK